MLSHWRRKQEILYRLDDEREVKSKSFSLSHMDMKTFQLEDILLTNRVRRPYFKSWTELVVDLWRKR